MLDFKTDIPHQSPRNPYVRETVFPTTRERNIEQGSFPRASFDTNTPPMSIEIDKLRHHHTPDIERT